MSSAETKSQALADVQAQSDNRNIPLEKVGISDLSYPITVLDRASNQQKTIAKISLSVNLPHDYRGAHLSRFVEALLRHHQKIGVGEISEILEDIRNRLQSEKSQIELSFPYFIERKAPVTGAGALMEYNCGFKAALGKDLDFILIATAPVTTLCPCSKEISERGAHNQRANITALIRFSDFVWLEEVIEIIESCGSSPVYPLLKREDEKKVTEMAYDNPRFVEDVVRDVAIKFDHESRITAYKIKAQSFESIHNHNAIAVVSKNWTDLA